MLAFVIFAVRASVTRLGDFWKILVANYITKIAKIFRNILDLFEKSHFE